MKYLFDKTNKGSGYKYQSQVYSAQGDMQGKQFDREALLKVTKNLGHNRVSVTVYSYMYLNK